MGLIIGYLLCLQVNWFIDICQVFVVPFSQWPTFNVNTRSPNKQSDYLIPSYCTCAFTCSHTYKKGVVVYTHFIINLQPYVLTPVLLWERSTICIATNIHTSIDILRWNINLDIYEIENGDVWLTQVYKLQYNLQVHEWLHHLHI